MKNSPNVEVFELEFASKIAVYSLAAWEEFCIWRCGCLREFTITGVSGFGDLDLATITACFVPTYLTNGAIFALAENCPGVQDLDFSATEISDEGVRAIAEDCLELRVIRLEGCDYITDAGLSALVAQCPKLRSVKVLTLSQPDDFPLWVCVVPGDRLGLHEESAFFES